MATKSLVPEEKFVLSLQQIFPRILPLRNKEMFETKDSLISCLCGTIGSRNELTYYEFNKFLGTNIRKEGIWNVN